MGQEKISVHNLDFFYSRAQALFGINVPFFDKSVTALMGPSGCGKSTLLRVLNRIYQLYPGQRATGEVLLDGVNVLDAGVDPQSLRRRVGMVAQKPVPFPMSIYENIAFGIRLFSRLRHRPIGERVEEALRRAALFDEVKDILWQSGAVAIRRPAAAIVHSPNHRCRPGGGSTRRALFGA